VELGAQNGYPDTQVWNRYPNTQLMLLSPLEKSGKSRGIWCCMEGGHSPNSIWDGRASAVSKQTS